MRNRTQKWITLIILAVLTATAVQPAAAGFSPGTLSRITMAWDGSEIDDYASNSSISADGQIIAFSSRATNLVSNDTNGTNDVFVHNRETGATIMVSVDSDGNQGNGSSGDPDLSADGRYVTFTSHANNLVTGDTNNRTDVFVHDLQTGNTERVSLTSEENQVNNSCYDPAISADGRYVVFSTLASNLSPADPTYDVDIYLRDRQTGNTEYISTAPDGSEGNGRSDEPRISDDGRYVVFHSRASNLVANDTNNKNDIFLHDRQTGATTRISMGWDGTEADDQSLSPDISGEGRYIVYESVATNLVPGDTNLDYDIFLYNTVTGQTTRISEAPDGSDANNSSIKARISQNGRVIVFYSAATNLITYDSNDGNEIHTDDDIFAYDQVTGTLTRISETADGTISYDDDRYPAVSGNGSAIVFETLADIFIPGDTNNEPDIYLSQRAFQFSLPLIIK
jgi:hypothetical protein